MIALAWIAFACAAIPALLYLWNSFLFREPPDLPSPQTLKKIPVYYRQTDCLPRAPALLKECHRERNTATS